MDKAGSLPASCWRVGPTETTLRRPQTPLGPPNGVPSNLAKAAALSRAISRGRSLGGSRVAPASPPETRAPGIQGIP